jgi:type I restriction enzyme S subunit
VNHITSIGNICTLQNGRAFKPEEWSESGIPIVRIQNLNDETKPFNYCKLAIDKKFHVQSGDLLFSWSGTPGTSFGAFFWNRGKGFLNQHIFRVETNDALVWKPYLKLALNSQLNTIIGHAHGGVGLQHITKGKLESVEIFLPPIAEQRRIAAILDQADTLRAKRREALAELDGLAQAIFVEMFGELRFNPNNWQTFCIETVCEFIVDCVNRTAPVVDHETPYRMIRTTNVKSGKVDLRSVRYVTEETFNI